jgi:hypothetical protein
VSAAVTDPVLRDQHLRHANSVRMGKVHVKAALGGMPRSEACEEAARICEDLDAITGALRVKELVQAMRRYGESATRAACKRAGIMTADRKLRDLTPRQRAALAAALRERSLLARTETQEDVL